MVWVLPRGAAGNSFRFGQIAGSRRTEQRHGVPLGPRCTEDQDPAVRIERITRRLLVVLVEVDEHHLES